MSPLTPARRRGSEILDDPGIDPTLAVRSLRDVALSNRLFGGSSAVLRELSDIIRENRGHSPLSLLDVGTGLGDIPAAARRSAAARGVILEAVGLDASEASLRARRDDAVAAVRADAFALPFADATFDVVVCSQLLHHFSDEHARLLLRELARVARIRVIVSDLRRSWFAAAGIWLASFPLMFHPVSRHDGVVSVLRGFTLGELEALVGDCPGARNARVESRLGFRVTASWAPAAVDAAREVSPQRAWYVS